MTTEHAEEKIVQFRDRGGSGEVLFDAQRMQRAGIETVDSGWFDPLWWGAQATPVSSGGRGGAWFIEGALGAAVLRHYLRGGFAARLSRDRYFWCGPNQTRSFQEFRLLRELHRRGLPVPAPLAAIYWRDGMWYRAAILLERLLNVRSLAERAAAMDGNTPWIETGALIAQFHRAGLDHADLNAHNLLFDDSGRGWVIDLDRSRLRIPATGWREANLARLQRSLLKLRGVRSVTDVERDCAVLRSAYDVRWQQGT